MRNIHDDHSKFPKGIIEVTSIELKYKDAQSGDEWVWPLKYLRKYGCDRDIFSFEAGRKCPGGEGLYAFSTKKASQLFDMVARNITEGGLEGGGGETGVLSPPELSRQPSHPPVSPPPVPSPNPPPPPVSDPPSHPPIPTTPRPLPEYTNIAYQNGQHVVMPTTENHASSTPPPLPRDSRNTPSPPPSKLNYTEVTLPEASKTTLEVEGEESQKNRVSYSEIDIKQTDQYNREVARKRAESARPLPDLGNAEFMIVTPAERPLPSRSKTSSRPPSSSSSAGSTSTAAGVAQRSMSEGNFAPPPPPSAGQHRGSNGFIPGRTHSHSASAVPDSGVYQNITVSKQRVAPPIPEDSESLPSPPPPHLQPNYMNLTPNPALSHHAHNDVVGSSGLRQNLSRRESEQQQTYQNLQVGMALSPPRVSGPAMALYADLVLGPKTSSTPKTKKGASDSRLSEDDHDHHVTLNFSGGSGVFNKTPGPSERSGRATSPPHAEVRPAVDRTRSSTEVLSPTAAASGVSSHDDTTVNYTTMNFDFMEALRKTKEEREEEKRQRMAEDAREQERKKKEEEELAANPPGKKKKKRKKTRRNSHQ